LTLQLFKEYLSSELDELQEEEIYGRCIEGLTKLLYVSPERLQNKNFLERIDEIAISFIAVDEAHCISEWGQDFRPSYQNIKNFRNQFKNVPCLALTATATPKVIEDIKVKLGFNQYLIFKKSFIRENIEIFIDELSDKYQYIFELLKNSNSSGIIYTRTRRDAEELSKFLQNRNLKNVDFFHAGLSVREKHQKQEKWLKSNNQVLISTNAFGMGIDKENVRFVIHFSPPASLENYYQEIGRAGRDGEKSYAFLLWNEQELKNLDDVFQNQTPNKTEFLKTISYLYSKFMIAENELPEQIFEVNISKIQEFTKISKAKIINILNLF
jgi:ATP-dependent DNA helicase RecQ